MKVIYSIKCQSLVAQYFEEKFPYNNIGNFQNNYHYIAHPQTVNNSNLGNTIWTTL